MVFIHVGLALLSTHCGDVFICVNVMCVCLSVNKPNTKCVLTRFSSNLTYRTIHNICENKSSSGDEIPERDVTYIILSVYLLITELYIERHIHFRDILLSSRYLLHIMDAGLQKASCVSLRVRPSIHIPCF